MAELMFKRGLQANLPARGDDGCFYLTTDTNRLYVGDGSGLALLNQTVQIVGEVKELPNSAAINDFFYCTKENILAVCTGINGSTNARTWTQINPNTNDTVRVTDITVVAGNLVEDENKNKTLDYTITLKQKKFDSEGGEYPTDGAGNEGNKIDDITATFTLSGDVLTDMVPDAASVGLEASDTEDHDKVEVKTNGTGSNGNQTITFSDAGENINGVYIKDGAITFDVQDTTYTNTVKTNDGKIYTVLNDGDADVNLIEYRAGKDLTIEHIVEEGKPDAIKFSHNAYADGSVASNNTNLERTDDDAKNLAPKHGEGIEFISDITYTNGHISEVKTDKFILPEDVYLKNVKKLPVDSDKEAENWTYELFMSDSGDDQAAFTIDFTAQAEALKNTLNQEIIDKIASANSAMTFKGTFDSISTLEALEDVELGDVYMFNGTREGNAGDYWPGDLTIATSKSGVTSGVLEDDDIKWERIPSGDDLNTDTLFKGVVTPTMDGSAVTAVSFGIKEDAENVSTDYVGAEFTVKAGTDLSLDYDSEANVTTIKHNAIEFKVEQAEDVASESIVVVTGVTVSDQGHVTQVNTQTFTPATYDLGVKKNENDVIIALTSGDATDDTAPEIGTIPIITGANLKVDVTEDNKELKFTHTAPVKTDTNKTAADNNNALTAGGSLAVIKSVEYDMNGHIVSVETGSVTLPDDENTTYDFKLTDTTGKAVTDELNPCLTLASYDGDTEGVAKSIQVNGLGNIQVKANGSAIDVQMVWGSF